MSSKIKAAIVQQPPVFLNLAQSTERALRFIREAASAGANLVVFPESWLPGYPLWLDDAPEAALWNHPPAKKLFRRLWENSPSIPGPEIKELQALCRELGIHLVMGLHEKRGATLYNTMLLMGPERYALHRKLTPTYTERLIWGCGDGSTLETLDTGFGSLGGLICWEHWMPLARAAMHARGEAVHAAQWPWVRDLHQIASRQYAFEGQCFVLAAGCPLTKRQVLEGYRSLGTDEGYTLLESLSGEPDEYLLRGGSAAIAPDTSYLAGPVFDQTATLLAELDLGSLAEGRMFLDTDGHYSRPDVFRLVVDTKPRDNVVFREAT